jgi:hypothetical protein
MDPPSLSSPRRDDVAQQDDDIDQIASQMKWGDRADISAQSGDDEANFGAESGDKGGPRIGQGAWVRNRWHDPLDPHAFPPRESRSREEFDPDYEPNPIR